MTALSLASTTGELGQLLDALGRDPHERLSVCHKTDGVFRSVLTTVAVADDVAVPLVGGDLWFGTQALHTRVISGRGEAKDVVGLRDLTCDLDVKPGGMPDDASAVAVITHLSEVLGTRPVAVVSTGHGMQPHWAIERDESTDWPDETDPRHLAAVALWRRWGRLVKTVALRFGGDADSVFDLSRVMRAPGSVNRKDPAAPVRVGLLLCEGSPVSLTRIAEACDEYGVPARPEDREVLGEVVAAHGDWTFAERTCGYVSALLRPADPDPLALAAGWAGDNPQARHPWLVSQAVRLAAAHRLGCITEADHARAVEVLSKRFRELLRTGSVREETPTELADAFAWGIVRVETFTEARARRELGGKNSPHSHPAEVVEPCGFWEARPVLTHVRTFARARRCSPWAVLGTVLARVVVAVPPDVVLPPLVGAEASLNLFVAAVGPSGGGKGASEAAAAAAVPVGPVEVATVGSGEGIGHLFAHREKGLVVRDRDAVLFTVPEVDNLTALGNRQGATLMPQLRSAWSGEKLGFSYADKNKALPIERHTYRLGLVLGVQPGRAGPLLDDADGGTPQRFLWMPTSDPQAPDEAPACPTPWQWPGIGSGPRYANAAGLTVLPVAQEARGAVDAATLARLRGEGDPLDGHRLLSRLKVAAALGLLDGRLEISVEDWHLAGEVLTVSDATRAGVVAHLAERATQVNAHRAEAEGARAVVVAEKLEGAKVKRVCRSVLKVLAKHGDWTTHRDVMAGISGVNRDAVPEALDRLIEAGQIEAQDDGGKSLYKLAGGGGR